MKTDPELLMQEPQGRWADVVLALFTYGPALLYHLFELLIYGLALWVVVDHFIH